MTNKTTNKYSPEVHDSSVFLVLDHECAHASRWAAIVSIADMIGCAPQMLNEWVKKKEVDKRAGVSTDMAARTGSDGASLILVIVGLLLNSACIKTIVET
jgi:transposase